MMLLKCYKIGGRSWERDVEVKVKWESAMHMEVNFEGWTIKKAMLEKDYVERCNLIFVAVEATCYIINE